jgi:hypothetical protein
MEDVRICEHQEDERSGLPDPCEQAAEWLVEIGDLSQALCDEHAWSLIRFNAGEANDTATATVSVL